MLRRIQVLLKENSPNHNKHYNTNNAQTHDTSPAPITATNAAKLFEKNVATRKRPAELLIAEPDARPTIINAILRDVATKNDIEKLKGEFREEISRL